MDRELHCKVVVVGHGKREFIDNYAYGTNYESKTSVGVDFASKTIQWDNNTTIHLQLWDLAENFKAVIKPYYKGTVGAFVIFDASKTSSFDSVVKWKQEINANVDEPIPVILLANNMNLFEVRWTDQEMDNFCKKNGFVTWFSVWSKTGFQVEIAVTKLVEKILENNFSDLSEPGYSCCLF